MPQLMFLAAKKKDIKEGISSAPKWAPKWYVTLINE